MPRLMDRQLEGHEGAMTSTHVPTPRSQNRIKRVGHRAQDVSLVRPPDWQRWSTDTLYERCSPLAEHGLTAHGLAGQTVDLMDLLDLDDDMATHGCDTDPGLSLDGAE